MTDEQSSQPLTDAELVAIRTRFDNRNGDMRSWGPVTLFHAAREVPRLLAEVDRLRAENDRLRKQVQDYHESADVHVAKFDRQHERLMEAESEVERLNLEVVQVQSGAQIAMNAGVAALQEVGRLEKKRDQLKEINDRMAEDRLRIIDERNRFKWMVDAALTLHPAVANTELESAQDITTGRWIQPAQICGTCHVFNGPYDPCSRYMWPCPEARILLGQEGAEKFVCQGEGCPGWKDSGICPQGLRHW